MVVLDVIHTLQATQAGDLAVPLELQGGQVRLVQRRDQRQAAPHVHDADGHFEPGETITVAPMKTFPLFRDLVTDVSYNFEKAKEIPAFKPGPKEARRHAADVAGGRGARPGVPEVHRVLPVPRTSAT